MSDSCLNDTWLLVVLLHALAEDAAGRNDWTTAALTAAAKSLDHRVERASFVHVLPWELPCQVQLIVISRSHDLAEAVNVPYHAKPHYT